MATKPVLQEGEAFVEGRSPEKAQYLLDQAESLGVDPRLVRTTIGGYIVPSAVAGEEQGEADPAEPDEQNDQQAEEDVSEETESEEEISEEDQLEALESQESDEQFDPADHKVSVVKAYLADADADERERVLAAEKDGKGRPSLLNTEGNEEKK